MITLSIEDKDFIRKTLKPLLSKGDWNKIRQICNSNGDYFHILCFMAENGIDILNGLSKISTNQFYSTGITQITIPAHIQAIEDDAFKHSALNTITFEDGVQNIGEYAFSGTSLSDVILPDTLETLGSYAFAYCKNLTSVFIPDSITILPKNLFEGSDNVTVYINSRKKLPKYLQLQIPRSEADWYREHTKIKNAEA